MNTPICDFVKNYCESGALRLHMPGHKGTGPMGFEALDLTEMEGADDLYHPEGIIAESERNASLLFGCPTVYSTEGSSQCIRAMVLLLCRYARHTGRAPLIAAARNVHKTFLSATALVDAEVCWLYPEKQDSYLSCVLTPAEVDRVLSEMATKPVAVYLTSPDYLGNLADIRGIGAVCHRHGVLLAVDNAHGAYLRFLPESMHPVDLGADLCCDSAHKTLPVVTGGAYLHFSHSAPGFFLENVKDALAMFGSTSPSYLILQSLDAANRYLSEGYRQRLSAFLGEAQELKARLTALGYSLRGDEVIKITIAAKSYGYTGTGLAAALSAGGIFCEFADPDFLVLMLTPETGSEGLQRLEQALGQIPPLPPISDPPPSFHRPVSRMSLREAAMGPCVRVKAGDGVGKILARASVGCPPAVPIVCCGEEISEEALRCFRYYGIEYCEIVPE